MTDDAYPAYAMLLVLKDRRWLPHSEPCVVTEDGPRRFYFKDPVRNKMYLKCLVNIEEPQVVSSKL